MQNALNDASKALRGSHVHVSGVAYKRDIDDVRESPALDIIHLLSHRGARITYSDPFVPSLRIDGLDLEAQDGLAAAKSGRLRRDCDGSQSDRLRGSRGRR